MNASLQTKMVSAPTPDLFGSRVTPTLREVMGIIRDAKAEGDLGLSHAPDLIALFGAHLIGIAVQKGTLSQEEGMRLLQEIEESDSPAAIFAKNWAATGLLSPPINTQFEKEQAYLNDALAVTLPAYHLEAIQAWLSQAIMEDPLLRLYLFHPSTAAEEGLFLYLLGKIYCRCGKDP